MLHFIQYIIAYDLWFYAVHRVLHIPWLYKQFHYQHHIYKHPEWNDTFSAHWVENTLSGLGIFLPLAWGCSFRAFVLAWIVCLGRGIARHDARWAWLVGTHHLRHHISPNKNFSSFYIDCLFNTAR